MKPYIIVICVVCFLAISVALFLILRFKKVSITSSEKKDALVKKNSSNLTISDGLELSIRFEDLPVLTEEEETRLVEVTDQKLLARIDGAIPGTLQAVANTGAIHAYQKAAQSAGQLYQAIIPKGTVLADSKAMKGAVRGIYHGSKGIAGQANLVAVDSNMGGGLAIMNIANAAMGVAAMLVGQYYMSQINNRLNSIEDDIDKIAGFQDNEYKSKVYALVAEIQKCSTFQVEIMENDELRNRELAHLRDLEHEAAQLLGQANLTLQEYARKNDQEFKKYEKRAAEANSWYQYQHILLVIMAKICELTYALNFGAVSIENCYAMYLPYVSQVEMALKQLKDWHERNVSVFAIDLASTRRKRQGIGGIIMRVPALINDNWNYKSISPQTVAMINKQPHSTVEIQPSDATDLFKEDVRLIAKEGKLYYLPNEHLSPPRA